MREQIAWKQEKGRTVIINRHLGLKIGITATAFVTMLLVGSLWYIVSTYTVRTVYVEGNSHYTDEEIAEKIMVGRFSRNSLYLKFKYRRQVAVDIPFVSAVEVKIVAPDAVSIRVYEKSFAGFVTYLGRCMYFDRDGVVVESSDLRAVGVPEVKGLKFDHVVMYEKLPVEDEEVFARILDITQSLDKYELRADRLFFDRDQKVTLYFEEVRVQIGEGSNIDEKFSRLKSILPELVGKKGALQMESFTGGAKVIPFKEDRK